MIEITITTMKSRISAIVLDLPCGICSFDVVTEFPNGYEVWNINNEDLLRNNLVPLCEVDENICVNKTSLKALRLDEFACQLITENARRRTVDKRKFNKLIAACNE